MATVNDWIEGARLRTLPASVAPVLAGTGIAFWMGHGSVVRGLLAAAVALAFQVGVNFSNDYSDGIRGTDDVRTGPPRLTGGGKAKPSTVKRAAFACFGIGCLAGLWLVALAGAWWMILAGGLAVVAAWYYTGGRHPYGYMGLGEVFVFVFFGLLATVGTTYTQALHVTWHAWVSAIAIGLIACALLMVNNIRDIPTDSVAGKNTLAVRLGELPARLTYDAMITLPLIMALAFIPELGWWLALLLPAAGLAIHNLLRIHAHHATGKALIPVLRDTGFLELAYGAGLGLAFALG
ncbi:1,4-dihydroxy-2-naphthoate polyprenyltransferase [Ancrocorticia populi]|uniref:1,4-dihydroxy-2-naphthoate octaprenyltransferase n=1 Tax=Ancrocorticia populi TaxID=2175228 RepID=A0A2V1KAE7_9ACTO|nr:1,4-dihydroxy-2-naphthoate polyprenyltransferase [Ancrocorticia populi]MDN6486765.1 1,4-dihydroxy-2-naphthoate polyprenyltransferase [Ancrocorticia sp.]PWF25931.1 1,4-dihydroxy-2-naphthoate polyprenyltransferase [Ancrocorticia populi]